MELSTHSSWVCPGRDIHFNVVLESCFCAVFILGSLSFKSVFCLCSRFRHLNNYLTISPILLCLCHHLCVRYEIRGGRTSLRSCHWWQIYSRGHGPFPWNRALAHLHWALWSCYWACSTRIFESLAGNPWRLAHASTVAKSQSCVSCKSVLFQLLKLSRCLHEQPF